MFQGIQVGLKHSTGVDATPRRVDPSESATLDAMDVVMRRAYGTPSFRVSIDRFVVAQPDGLAVVEHNGSVVGAGCCVAYTEGGFGWIGLVATAPGFERQGIATAITESLSGVLAAHGCASVLDASAVGGAVYERMGFADHGFTQVMEFGRGDSIETGRRAACVPLGGDDLDDVVAFDAVRFGAPRPSLLAKVTEQHRGRALVLRRHRQVVGYAVAQQATLAPVVADDAEAVTDLIAAALRLDWRSPPRINVPPESAHVTTLLRLGFELRRGLRHMRRGIEVLPGRRASIAGQISLGEG